MDNCPKCNYDDMEVIDYYDTQEDEWALYTWECRCPNCNYHGKYYRSYKFTDEEWEELKE